MIILLSYTYLHFSTAKLSEVRIHVLGLLNRHSMVFGNYRWAEFDDDFLQKHVQTVDVVDLEDLVTRVCNFGLLCECFPSSFRSNKQSIKALRFIFSLPFSHPLSLLIWRAAMSLFTSSLWMRMDPARSVWRRTRSFQQPVTGCCQQVTLNTTFYLFIVEDWQPGKT